jgi:molybdate transport system substrate-binding protein
MLRPVALLLACSFAQAAHADEVQIAVASNFSAPMKQIAAQFEQDTGHKVRAAYGATGALYAQIRNGAPFDILLAADAATPARLENERAAVADSRFTYAVGRLVLWSAQPGLVDDQAAVLRAGKFAHLAIANPTLAPYGMAAVQVLQKLNLYGALAPKLVQGENISQAHQFVVSGAAPLGFVAMSQVVAGGRLTSGSGWMIPAEMHAPIRQEGVLLLPGQGKRAAAAFLTYLQGDKAGAVIRSYGYDR